MKRRDFITKGLGAAALAGASISIPFTNRLFGSHFSTLPPDIREYLNSSLTRCVRIPYLRNRAFYSSGQEKTTAEVLFCRDFLSASC